ncbi:MAG: YkgJ family cysteine cluster protein [Oscillospiraceae bacterium]|nr:YkgJ family cysteine cluster protein [Oscillospiraceae bacterium]
MEERVSFTSEQFREFYRRLDEVAPVSFDCGMFCGASCCDYEGPGGENLGLYLLPGEEGINPTLKADDTYDIDGELFTFAKCVGTSTCIRDLRPIQCRTYPLVPHIDADGDLKLIYNDSELPYGCPLVEQRARLNIEFVEETTAVWKELVRDPSIRKYVEIYSVMRDDDSVTEPEIIDNRG